MFLYTISFTLLAGCTLALNNTRYSNAIVFEQNNNATSKVNSVTVQYGGTVLLKWDMKTKQKYNCYVTNNDSNIKIGEFFNHTINFTNGIKTDFNERLTVWYNRSKVELQIKDVVFSDSVNYHCRSESYTETKRLIVVGGPLYKHGSLPLIYDASVKTNISTEVVYCGYPKPTVNWSINNVSFISEGIEILNDNATSYSRQFCYRYVFTLTQLYNSSCKRIIKFIVKGYSGSFNKFSDITFRPKPVNLQNIRTTRFETCLLTKWDGPVVSPGDCSGPFTYDVRLQMKSKLYVVYNVYSTAFQVCNTSVAIGDVIGISVRHNYKFAKGTYKASLFTKENETANNTKETNSKSLVIVAVVLGVMLIVFIILFLVCFSLKRCGSVMCKIKPKKIKKENIIHKGPITDVKPGQSIRSKSRIKKEMIMHKPQPLHQVLGRQIPISNNDAHSIRNQYTDEDTWEKGYMPLNTLQKRISESLQTYGQINYARTTHRYNPTNKGQNITTGSDSPYYTPIMMQAYNAGEALTRDAPRHLKKVTSLNNLRSEYDVKNEKRKNIYDLPRSQTFNQSVRPRVVKKKSQNSLDRPNLTRYNSSDEIHHARPNSSELPDQFSKVVYDSNEKLYDRPNSGEVVCSDISRHHCDEVIYANSKLSVSSSSDKGSSNRSGEVYDTPRNTLYIPIQEDDDSTIINNNIPDKQTNNNGDKAFHSPQITRVAALYESSAETVSALNQSEKIENFKPRKRKNSFSLAIETSKVDFFDFYDVDVPSRSKENLYDSICDTFKIYEEMGGLFEPNVNSVVSRSKENLYDGICDNFKIYEEMGGQIFDPNVNSVV